MVDAPIPSTQDPQVTAAAVTNPQVPAAAAPEPALLDEPSLLEEPPLESPGQPEASPQVPQGTFPTDSVMAASAGGVARAAFATKDFLTGGTPSEADKSPTRKAIEANANASADSSTVNSLVSGISQFAIGMLGVGKLKALTGAAGVLEGTAVGSSIQAAAVGAAVFDPHGGNVANLIQSVPALQNPVTKYLAAGPDDSEALAMAKNAMLSIGLDAAVTGLFTAGMKSVKAIRGGNPEAIAAAHTELQDAVEAHGAAQDAKEVSPAPINDNAAATGTIANDTGAPGAAADVRVVDNATQGAKAATGEPLPAAPKLLQLDDFRSPPSLTTRGRTVTRSSSTARGPMLWTRGMYSGTRLTAYRGRGWRKEARSLGLRLRADLTLSSRGSPTASRSSSTR